MLKRVEENVTVGTGRDHQKNMACEFIQWIAHSHCSRQSVEVAHILAGQPTPHRSKGIVSERD